ncbi:MAG TPA: hypothetical protein VF588_22715 [Pyrinomonadaceae bacterium]|jgi:uncharacterized protein affecting Mg2+/Co2+ transport
MRRVLSLCCLALALCGAARAQAPAPAPADAAAPPDVVVLKYGWAKERLNWQSDPFAGTNETFDDVRRRLVDQRRAERARASGNTAEAAKVEQEMRSEQVIRSRPPAPPRYAFRYKISIRNSGPKAIREIDWDYVFTDAATGEVLGRREFTGVERIAPGKEKELNFLTVSAPAGRISLQSLNKKERDGMTEQAVVVRVLYEDGTVWHR